MIERGNRVSLSLKARRMLPLDPLDRNDPIQTRIESLPHFAHPASADQREDFVRAQFCRR
jgi:hypothetical protein